MPIVLAQPTTIAATTASVVISSGLPATGTIEAQLSFDPDFAFCVCPVITGLPRSSPIDLKGLNQSATYYMRARGRLSDGTAENWSNIIAFSTPQSVARDLTPAAVMIQPAMIVVPNPILSIVTSNPIAGYPAENLLFDAPVAMRASVNGSWQVLIDIYMAPTPVDTFAFLMTNLPEAATISVRGGSTAAIASGASPAYNSGNLPFRASANLPGRPGYHCVARLPAPQTFPFWRIILSAPNYITGGLVHAEHLVIGLNRTTKNHSVDKTDSPFDTGSIERLRSGVPDRTRGLRMRRVDFDISMITEAQDAVNYDDLSYRVGSTDPVLVIPNSKAGAFFHDRILYGTVTMKGSNPSSPRYTRSFTIESILP